MILESETKIRRTNSWPPENIHTYSDSEGNAPGFRFQVLMMAVVFGNLSDFEVRKRPPPTLGTGGAVVTTSKWQRGKY